MNKDTTVRQKKRKSIFQKLGASMVAIALVIAMTVGVVPAEVAAAKTSDLGTTSKFTESLGDNVSTEYAGRIWTDKSVFAEGATFTSFGGESTPIEKKSGDFLVSYSALATSQSVSGKQQAPIDVVFVIDLSGSMVRAENVMDNGQSRLYNMVQALNASVKKLVTLNEHVRIGVIGYNNTSRPILPLDTYKQNGTREFFSVSGNTITYNAIGTKNSYDNKKISTQSGTNIQKGLYEGMRMLAEEESTSVTIGGTNVPRVPSVILLTDGEPSIASTEGNWWNLSKDNSQPMNTEPRVIYGMKALMTASYMKKAIDRNYGGGSHAVKVYSIGMGITGVSNIYRPFAYATINPNDNTLKNQSNSWVRDMRNTWTKYANNQTAELGGYTFNHPASNDIVPANKDISGLYYVDTYYDADNAASVTDVFASIVNNISISRPEVPTEHDETKPMDSGYITYTDPIGKYMEVKDMQTILYAGSKYEAKTKTTSGTATDYVDTYVFSGDVSGNPVYGTHNLDEIVIEVHTKVTNGIKDQTVVIKIPAGAIPIRVNTVELNVDGTVKSHTNNGTYPVRVLYTVGLQDGLKKDGYIDTTKVSEEYLAKNMNQDGTVNFYSNLYTGTNKVNGRTAGDATVEFEPAHTNPFYYIQENTPIYTDEELTVKASASSELVDNLVYYYADEHYHGNTSHAVPRERTGKQLKNAGVINVEGSWNRPVGSPRLNRILEFEGTKVNNSTETAQDFYAPTFVQTGETAYDGKFVVYLGNNGVMKAVAGGTLEITKSVTADAGLTAPDKSFEFTVTFNNEGTYTYEVLGTQGSVVLTGTIATGGKINLKAGQTARIINVAPGTKYTVTETAVDGFKATVTGGEGTIAANTTSTAKFENHYSVEPAEVTFGGTKTLMGRDWKETDKFVFRLSSPNNAPLPENTTVTVTGKTGQDGASMAFDFDKIEYTVPGTFRYTIVELTPGMSHAERLSGVSYTREAYEVTVVVEDNGEGKLEITSKQMVKVQDAAGKEISETVQLASFTNTYATTSVLYGPVAEKIYTDNSGEKSLVDGMFTFQMKPAEEKNTEANVPMPEGTKDGVFTSHNVGRYASFGQIEFTSQHKDKTYYYELSEVKGTVNGMEYDETKIIVEVKVTTKNVDNVEVVEVTPKYFVNNSEVSSATFSNVYTPESITVPLVGTKTMVGRDMLAGEEFTFAWNTPANAGIDYSGLNQTVLAKDGKDGTPVELELGNVTITKPGTYTFELTEVIPTEKAGGVTYDEVAKQITIVVKDNDGKLELVNEVSYDNGSVSEDTDKAVFVNSYEVTPVVSTAIKGLKNFTGKELKDGMFFVEVSPVGAAPMTKIGNLVSVPANGEYEVLGNITFTEAGTYKYIVREQIPEEAVDGKLDGITYDDTIYGVKIIVVDNLDGTLSITKEIDKIVELVGDNGEVIYTAEEKVDASVERPIKFNNSYTTTPAPIIPLEMTKILSGNRMEGENAKPLQAGEFTFKKSIVSGPENGATFGTYPTIIKETTITNEADGSVQFGAITFVKPGIYVIKIEEVIPANANKVPGVTYDSHTIQSTFEVTDNGIGGLEVIRTGTVGSREFVNEYKTTGYLDGKTNLNVTKVFTGRNPEGWLDTDSFTFVLEANNDVTRAAIAAGTIKLPSETEITITGKEVADGETTFAKAFGNIIFNVSGDYQFLIREEAGNIVGVNYDATARVINVKAVDNGKGSLTVTVPNAAEKNPTFNNEYDPGSVVLAGHGNLRVNKVLTGREWKDGETFTFTIAPAENYGDKVGMPSETTLAINKDNNGVAHFGNITFYEPGKYEFVVTETVPTGGVKDGVTYDTTVRKVNVTVTDDTATGALVVAVDNLSAEGYLTFTNKYETEETFVEGATNLGVSKVLAGRNWKDGERFTFTIESYDEDTKEAEAGKVIEFTNKQISVTKDNQSAYFGNIIFHEAGTYKFIMKESVPTTKADNMEYDEHSVIVTVIVEDNLSGKLNVTKVSKEGETVWTNVYTPEPAVVTLSANKSIAGRDWLNGEVFNFILTAANGTPMPERTVVKTDANHNIAFGPITYTAEGTHKYYISEIGNYLGITNDSRTLEATVTVTNGMDGKYVASVVYQMTGDAAATSEKRTFVNTYDSIGYLDELTVTKVFTGRPNDAWLATDSFTFKLEATGATAAAVGKDVLMPASTLIVDAANKDDAKFGSITFKEAGTYTFTVTEQLPAGATQENNYTVNGIKYDPVPRKLTVVVVDNWDGTLTATLSSNSDALQFTNTYDSVMHDEKDITVMAEKVVLDGTVENGKYTFVVLDETGKEIKKVTNSGETIVLLDSEKYEEPGKHVYYIKEQIPQDAEYIADVGFVKDSIVYDTTIYRLAFEIVDDQKGNLALSDAGLQLAVVDENKNVINTVNYDNFVFKNVAIQYGNLVIEKDVKHPYGAEYKIPDAVNAFTMEVTLKKNGEAVVGETYKIADSTETVTTDNTGKFEVTLKDGEKVTILGIEEGIEATVVEKDKASFTPTYYPSNKVTIERNASAAVVVENTYSASPVTIKIDIQGTKTVEGTWSDQVFKFYFQKYVDGRWTTIATDTASKADPTIDFEGHSKEALTFDKVGTYEYQVIEENHGLTISGVTYDATMHTFNVLVTDNDMDGKLEAKIESSHHTSDGAGFTFVDGVWKNYNINFKNIINVGYVSRTIMIQKDVEDTTKDTPDLSGYVFELYETDADYKMEGAKLVETSEPTDMSGETYVSKALNYTYDSAKNESSEEFYYVLKEKNTGVKGVTYTDKVYKFKVIVAHKNDGSITADLVADPSTPFKVFTSVTGHAYIEAGFKNIYNPADAKLVLDINKVLTGRNGKTVQANEFAFEVCEVAEFNEGNIKLSDKVETVYVGANGKAVFEKSYSKVGTHYYQVKEVIGNVGGVTYDKSVYYVRVTVSDVNNALVAKTVVLNDSDNTITFNNKYAPAEATVNLKAKKQFNATLYKDMFEFALVQTDVNGNVVSGGVQEKIANAANGDVTFSKITFKKAGTYYFLVGEVKGTEAGMAYDSTMYRYKVDVKDNLTGNLVAYVTLQKLNNNVWADENTGVPVFVNTYNSPALKITKFQAVNAGELTKEKLPVEGKNVVTYMLEIENTKAGSVAENVVVTDDIRDLLNAGFKLVDAGTATNTNGILTWSIGTVASNDKVQVSFKVEVPNVVGEWDNVATAAYEVPNYNTEDPDDTTPVNETSNKVIIYNNEEANVSIHKVQSLNGATPTIQKLTVVEGDKVTYTLQVRNDSKAASAKNLVITDDISDLIADGFVLTDSGKATVKDNVLVWNESVLDELKELKAGEYVNVSFTVEVPGTAEDVVWDNMATVSYKVPNEDPTKPDKPVGPVDSNEVEIEEYAPALEIHKAQAIDGENFTTKLLEVEKDVVVTYRLQVKNIVLNSVATNLIVTDDISDLIEAGFELVDKGEATENGNVLTWEIDRLAGGDTVEFTFQVKAPDKVGRWDNVATVTDQVPGDDPSTPEQKEEESEIVEVKNDEAPVLVIEKLQALNDKDGAGTTDKLTVIEGDKVTYILKVTNTTLTEGAVATNVIVTDNISELLAAGFEVEGMKADKDGNLVWNIEAINPGETKEVRFTVTVADVSEDTSWDNMATVTYDKPDNETEDPDDTTPADPAESNEVKIEQGVPKLVVLKEQGVNLGKSGTEVKEVKVGDVVIYTIYVTNEGTETAKGVTITDKIPTGLKLVKGILGTKFAISDGGVESNGIITWIIDELAVGETVKVRFAVKVPEIKGEASWKNIAVITYDNNVDNPEDGESEIPTNEVIIKGKETAPMTGDATHILTWMAMAAASLASVIVMLQKKKRKEIF